MNPTPNWKLPVGISRGLWDYVRDPALARSYDARLAGTPLLEYDLRFAARWLPAPGWLIDLGCGTGRLLVQLAGRGFSGLGVDLSEEMLRLAAEKARRAGVAVSLVRANLVELDGVRDASFDCAACLFSTLGMIRGSAERRQALRHFHRVLRPGGRMILHVHNVSFHMWTPAGRRWLLRDCWRRLRGAPSRGDFEMPAHSGITGLALHHYSRREIGHELRRAGFRILHVEPVSLRADSRLCWPRWFPGLRAYGYLLAAERI